MSGATWGIRLKSQPSRVSMVNEEAGLVALPPPLSSTSVGRSPIGSLPPKHVHLSEAGKGLSPQQGQAPATQGPGAGERGSDWNPRLQFRGQRLCL